MKTGPRWQSGDAVRIRCERWTVQRHTAHGTVSTLDVLGADAGNSGERARFLLPFEPVEPVISVRTARVVRPTRWRMQARAVLAAATPRIDSLRTAVRSRFIVMPFQLEPALAILTGAGCRVLIADEVGLGKTVQAGLILAEVLDRQPDGRALVLCPAGLRAQWQHELAARFGLSSTLLDAAGVAQAASHFDATANPWSACRLIVASIDFIKRPEVMRAVEGLVWDVVVLDEAHNLTARSDRGTAAAALAWRARTVVMLSATPHSGDETAFARLCSLGDTAGRFPLLFYRRTRDDAGMPVKRRVVWLEVRPTPAESSMLDALLHYARRVWLTRPAADAPRLAMSVLIRRAISSATSLARSVERRLASLDSSFPSPLAQLGLPLADGDEDEEPTLSVQAAGLDDLADERRQLEHLLALARVAAIRESKVRALVRWLARAREPVLVFTEYRDTLAHVRRSLAAAGVPDDAIAELHGGLTRTERQTAEIGFTAGRTRVLLATDAASEGLNLHQRSRCVVNLEVPWNPVRLQQRIGRVDRIGQQRCVHAVNLVAAGTPETTTVRRLLEREQRAMGALRRHRTPEIATAEAVLSGMDVPDAGDAAAHAVPLRRPDLSPRAAGEASWIATARRLRPGHVEPVIRPFVSVAQRSPRRLLWTTEFLICNGDGSPVWPTLVTLAASLRSVGQSRSDITRALDEIERHWQTIADAVGEHVGRSANDAFIDPLRVAAEREHAIGAALRLRHARIAAELVQPGLFDRRADRRASSQSAVLEEALGQCQRRLDELAKLRNLTANASAFRFALFS